MSGPSWEEALRKYRRRARRYDRLSAPMRRYREAAVDLLQLERGQTVLDIACGTGANFPAILHRIGPEASLVGVDLSAEMLAEARNRISSAGWENVSLIEAPVERADLPDGCDAALFSLTHDVLQSRAAIANVIAHLRDRGRVACFGTKWAGAWRVPVNVAVWLAARSFVTTFDGFDHPWALLDEYVALQVRPVALGGAYLAAGRLRPDAQRLSTTDEA
jgi:SAM-dependent methyltransferase